MEIHYSYLDNGTGHTFVNIKTGIVEQRGTDIVFNCWGFDQIDRTQGKQGSLKPFGGFCDYDKIRQAIAVACGDQNDIRQSFDNNIFKKFDSTKARYGGWGDCSGLLYGITGMCHQMANRVLSLYDLSLNDHILYYGITTKLYGNFGIPLGKGWAHLLGAGDWATWKFPEPFITNIMNETSGNDHLESMNNSNGDVFDLENSEKPFSKACEDIRDALHDSVKSLFQDFAHKKYTQKVNGYLKDITNIHRDVFVNQYRLDPKKQIRLPIIDEQFMEAVCKNIQEKLNENH